MSGVCALGFHPVFDGGVNLAYTTILPALTTSLAITACQERLAALFILPQSVLLGMTVPLLSGASSAACPTGAALAGLDVANNRGGALGVLASVFVFIRLLGLPSTMAAARIIHRGLAGLVWSLAGGAEGGNR